MKLSPTVTRIQRRQTDRKLAELSKIKPTQPPSTGWIKAIRESLGMTVAQLAKRVGVAPSTLHQLEKNERNGTISLKSLRQLAAALECEVVYAVLPKHSLEEIVDKQALRIAKKLTAKASHSMALEDQQISQSEETAQTIEVAKELKEKRPSSIWEGV